MQKVLPLLLLAACGFGDAKGDPVIEAHRAGSGNWPHRCGGNASDDSIGGTFFKGMYYSNGYDNQYNGFEGARPTSWRQGTTYDQWRVQCNNNDYWYGGPQVSPWWDWHSTRKLWRQQNQQSVEVKGLASSARFIRTTVPEFAEATRSLVKTTRSQQRRRRQAEVTLRRSSNNTINITTTRPQHNHDTHDGGDGGAAWDGGEVYSGWW